MRKLPVFLLLDVSESVAGPLQASIVAGVEAITKALRSDPQSLETVHISIIVFAGKAKVLVPMTEITQFHYPPALPVGGGTAMGVALETLMTEIDTHVVKGSPGQKADWKPLVFLMTDGRPTDDPSRAIAEWRDGYAKRARLISLSVGGGADLGQLREISDDVIVLANTSPESIGRLFSWMSQSVSVHSQAIDTGRSTGGVDLTKSLPEGAVSLEKEPAAAAAASHVDERLAVLVGRCQNYESPFLVRYERSTAEQPYRLRQAITLSSTYFDLTDDDGRPAATVGSGELSGMPACPACGNAVALVSCDCGQLHCIDGPGPATCPWCAAENDYQPAPAGVRGEFRRGAG